MQVEEKYKGTIIFISLLQKENKLETILSFNGYVKYYTTITWFMKKNIIMQASVSGASVKGLKGCKTLNKDPDPKNPVEGKEERWVGHFY